MADAEKSAKIDALWQSLKRRSEQRLKQRKPPPQNVNWNVSYDTPRRPKRRATSTDAGGTKNTASTLDAEIPGIVHVETVAAPKPVSLTEEAATEQARSSRKVVSNCVSHSSGCDRMRRKRRSDRLVASMLC